jgi:hypothetical protein
MDGNWPAAVVAVTEQIGIGQVGDVPVAGHALLIQEMRAFDERAAALPGVSASSSVVRSMRRTASLRTNHFDFRSTPAWRTRPRAPPRRRSRCAGTAACARSHRRPAAQPALRSRRIV